MYRSRRDYYREQRRKRVKEGLKTVLWVVTVICIIIICVTMAVQTKASQVVAAESHVVQQASPIDVNKAVDVAKTMNTGQELVEAAVVNRAKAEAERVIIIDPGHGGIDGGCGFDGVLEKDINRQIANKAAKKLRDMGYKVKLARAGDSYIEKADRVAQANLEHALLYVSIHQNSCEVNSVSGIETWYGANDLTDESRRLAQFVQQETISATGAVCRELVVDDEMCVINKSTMPSCLIETGFLSNKSEREKLCTEEYQEQVAEGIAEGIDLYLSSDSE